jgi:hypothetical protein
MRCTAAKNAPKFGCGGSQLTISAVGGERGSAACGVLQDCMAHQDNDLAPLLSEISIRREYWLVWPENLHGPPRLWVQRLDRRRSTARSRSFFGISSWAACIGRSLPPVASSSTATARGDGLTFASPSRTTVRRPRRPRRVARMPPRVQGR